MKHIIILFSMSALFLFVSCDKDNVEPQKYGDATWARERIDNANTGYIPNIKAPRKILESTLLYKSDFLQKNTPVLKDGILYFGENFIFKAINISTGEEIWTIATEDNVYSSAVVDDNVLYFGDDTGYFYAVDSKTGHNIWSIETFGKIRCSPIVLGDMVYFSSNAGGFYALNKVTGDLIWSKDIDGYVGNAAYSTGKIIFGSESGDVYAVDPVSGSELWKFTDPERNIIESGIAVMGDIVIVPTGGGLIYAIDLNNGNRLWKFETDHRISFIGDPAVTNKVVVIGSWSSSPQAVGSKIYCLDLFSGDVIWTVGSTDTHFAIVGSPIIANDVVVIGDIGQGLHGLDLNSGHSLWNFSDPDWNNVQTSPIILDGLIIVPFASGNLYTLQYEDN